MLIKLYLDGNAKVVAPERVYQGSNNATELILLSPHSPTTVFEVYFKLPSGVLSAAAPMYHLQDIEGAVSAWGYKLPESITGEAGKVGVVFNAISQDGNRTSYIVNIDVLPSILPELPPEPDMDVYELLLQYYGEIYHKLDEIDTAIEGLASKDEVEELRELTKDLMKDFTVDDTGLCTKYYADGRVEYIQFPTGGTGGGSGSGTREIGFANTSAEWTAVNGGYELAFSPTVTGRIDSRFIASIESIEGGGAYSTLAHAIYKGSDGSILVRSVLPFTGRILIGGSGGGGGDIGGLLYNPRYNHDTHILSFDIVGGDTFEVDLPIEQLIEGLAVDGTDLVLTLESGEEQRVPMSELLVGVAKEAWVTNNYVSKEDFAEKAAIKSGYITVSNGVRYYTYVGDVDPKTIMIEHEFVPGITTTTAAPVVLDYLLRGAQAPSFYTLDMFEKLRDIKISSLLGYASGSIEYLGSGLWGIQGIGVDTTLEDKLVFTAQFQTVDELYYVTVTLINLGHMVQCEYVSRTAGEGGGTSAQTVLFGSDKFVDGIAEFTAAETGQTNDRFVASVERLEGDKYVSLAHAVYKGEDGGVIVKAGTPFDGRIVIGGGGSGGGGEGELKSGYVELEIGGEAVKALYQYRGAVDPKGTLISYAVDAINYLIPLPIVLGMFASFELGQLSAASQVDYNLLNQLSQYDITSVQLGVNSEQDRTWFGFTRLVLSLENDTFYMTGLTNDGTTADFRLIVPLDHTEETAEVSEIMYKVLGEGGGSEEYIHNMLAEIPDLGEVEIICRSKSPTIQDVLFGDTWVSGAIAPIMVATMDEEEELPNYLVSAMFANKVTGVFINFYDEEEDDIFLFGCDSIDYVESEGKPFKSMTLNACSVPGDDDIELVSFKVIFFDTGDVHKFESMPMGGGGVSGSSSEWNLLNWRTESQYWGLVSSRGSYGRAFQLELVSYATDAYIKLAINMTTNSTDTWDVRVMEAYNANNLFPNLKLGAVWRNGNNTPSICLYVDSGTLENNSLGWRVSNPQELEVINREEGGVGSHLLDIYTQTDLTLQTILDAINN